MKKNQVLFANYIMPLSTAKRKTLNFRSMTADCKSQKLKVKNSTFPCSIEQSFLDSLLPERLRLSAAGRNGMRFSKQIARVSPCRPPGQKCEGLRTGES